MYEYLKTGKHEEQAEDSPHPRRLKRKTTNENSQHMLIHYSCSSVIAINNIWLFIVSA